MANLNKFCLQGRLGKDPLVTTPGVKTKVNLNLAVETVNGKTIWIRVAAWEKTGEFIAKHFKNGDMIVLDGHIDSYKPQNSAYEIMELIAEHAYFPGSQTSQKKEEPEDPYSYDFVETGDLPF